MNASGRPFRAGLALAMLTALLQASAATNQPVAAVTNKPAAATTNKPASMPAPASTHKPAPASASAPEITPEQAKSHVGQKVTVCGRVADAKYLENSKTKPTLLNFGAPHPNEVFTVIIKPETRAKFTDLPEALYYRKEVCVTGEVRLYKEKPEMEVTDPSQIRLKPAPKTP